MVVCWIKYLNQKLGDVTGGGRKREMTTRRVSLVASLRDYHNRSPRVMEPARRIAAAAASVATSEAESDAVSPRSSEDLRSAAASAEVTATAQRNDYVDVAAPSVEDTANALRARSDSEEEAEDAHSEPDSARRGPRCRICFDAVCREQFDDGEGIQLDCCCQGDLGVLHRECAERWFQRKRNLLCDVCAAPVSNVRLLPPLPGPQRGRSTRSRRTGGTTRRASTPTAQMLEREQNEAVGAATKQLFPLSVGLSAAIVLYFLFQMAVNVLVAVALATLSSVVFCGLGAQEIIWHSYDSRKLVPWLLWSAIVCFGWTISLSELINQFAYSGGRPLIACTAGACAACGVMLIHFKHRSIIAGLSACSPRSRARARVPAPAPASASTQAAGDAAAAEAV